jgi:cell division protease FtsH
VPCGPDVDWRAVAAGSPGLSGAQLANLVNEAGLAAARAGRPAVAAADCRVALAGAQAAAGLLRHDAR